MILIDAKCYLKPVNWLHLRRLSQWLTNDPIYIDTRLINWCVIYLLALIANREKRGKNKIFMCRVWRLARLLINKLRFSLSFVRFLSPNIQLRHACTCFECTLVVVTSKVETDMEFEMVSPMISDICWSIFTFFWQWFWAVANPGFYVRRGKKWKKWEAKTRAKVSI